MKVAYPGVDEDADFPKKGYAMRDDTVVALRQPGSFSDDFSGGISRKSLCMHRLIEKIAPGGHRFARVAGALFVAAGAYIMTYG